MALQFLNDGYFTSKVGIGTNSPDAKLHVEGGIGIFNVSDDWQQSSLGTYLFRGANFATTISNETSTLKIFPATSSKAVGNYWGGINFMHLDPENSSWGTAFTGSQFWIGGRITSLPGQELSALVFATNSSSTAGSSPTEKMVILPNGDVGIGTIDPDEKLDVAGKVQVTGTSLTVLNASDPIIQVSDTDTNYKGAMRWLSSDNVLEFYTRYAGTYYTSNLVLDRGNVGIGTTSPDSLLHIYNPSANWDEEAVITLGTDIEGTNQAQLRYYRGLTDATTESFQLSVSGTTALTALYNGKVGIGTQAPNALLEVDSITYSANNAIANFVNGNNPVRLAYDTVVIAQTDVPCLHLVETIDGSQANEQKLSFSVGDGKAIIRSSATAISGLYINVAGTNTAPGYNTADGLNAIRVLNNGNTAFNYKVGIGTTNPILKLHIEGTNSLPATSGIAQNGGIRIENGVNNGVLDIGASNATGAPGWLQATDKTDLSQAYKLLLNPNGGDVGIGTTTPQSKLQVAGGIQMADDTATASASKVGTMRYRTGTEYVEVNGTELITNGDFASSTDWTLQNSASINNSTGVATVPGAGALGSTNGNWSLSQASVFAVSTLYRLRFQARRDSGTASEMYVGQSYSLKFNQVLTAAWVQYETVFTSTSNVGWSELSFGGVVGTTSEVKEVSVMEVIQENASYADMCMQTGSSTYEWVNIVRNTY